jgi:hypothetical protein
MHTIPRSSTAGYQETLAVFFEFSVKFLYYARNYWRTSPGPRRFMLRQNITSATTVSGGPGRSAVHDSFAKKNRGPPKLLADLPWTAKVYGSTSSPQVLRQTHHAGFAKTLQVPLQFLADLEGPRSMTASPKKTGALRNYWRTSPGPRRFSFAKTLQVPLPFLADLEGPRSISFFLSDRALISKVYSICCVSPSCY